MDNEQPSLLVRIEAYIDKYQLAPTQFARMVGGSLSLVARFREGQIPRPATVERVEQVLSAPPPGWNSPRSFKVRAYRKATIENQKREAAEVLHRQTDGFERARLFLQQRHVTVFASWVTTGDQKNWDGKFFMGSALVTAEDVMARARAKGWVG